MRLLERAHRTLESSQIPHAVIGAAALAVHGVSRSTLDVDLLVYGRRCLEPKLWNQLSAEGVVVDVRRGDSDDPLAGVIRLEQRGERLVDVIVGRSKWQQEIIGRAARTRLGDFEIPVALAPDLVLLKLYAGGVQDRWDVQQLLAAVDRDAIVAAVDENVPKLPARCRRLWKELRTT
ncbi:MAG: hypothetical protein ACREQQ_03390 [Candidatus Binatia bacterium]